MYFKGPDQWTSDPVAALDFKMIDRAVQFIETWRLRDMELAFAFRGHKHVVEVPVEKYCSFDPDHAFRKPQFQAIVQALAGCRAVVTAMIGDYPRQELERAGIVHVNAVGPIEPALLAAHDQVCGCGCACEGKQQC